MAKKFRPGFWFQYDKNKNTEWVSKPTFVELRKEILRHLIEYDCKSIETFRHRRGEWGEWFEEWELCKTKIVCVRQGWM